VNPAFSVIFFTTSSGAGYGMLMWLGVLAAAAELPAQRGFLLLALGVAFVLVSLGLLASTLHLGHPERAWRAFSQWRSSWLSREGIAAIVCFVPLGVAAVRWVWWGESSSIDRLIGGLLAFSALVTVYCTARIYSSLKTIDAWQHALVVPGYLGLSLVSGALLLLPIAVWSLGEIAYDWPRIALLVATLTLAAGILKARYWQQLAHLPARSTMNSATGLPGALSSFERPHTEDNYLLNEMGFRLGRKHATRLRRISLWLAFIFPIGLLILLGWLSSNWFVAILGASALIAALGISIERWLFFAEAKHVVRLYYDV